LTQDLNFSNVQIQNPPEFWLCQNSGGFLYSLYNFTFSNFLPPKTFEYKSSGEQLSTIVLAYLHKIGKYRSTILKIISIPTTVKTRFINFWFCFLNIIMHPLYHKIELCIIEYMEFTDKQKIRRFCYSKFTIGILILILIMMIPGVYGIYTKVSESSKDRKAAERELVDLQTREKMLLEKLEIGNSERGQEEQIREKFNVAKEGESVIILVEKPVPASTTVNEANVFKAMWDKIKTVF
jgi:cell division protein FtsB